MSAFERISTLSIAMGLILAAGCGLNAGRSSAGANPLPPSANAPSAGAGAFSAQYMGKLTSPRFCELKFSGNGKASFLGAGTEVGSIWARARCSRGECGCSFPFHGKVMLSSASKPFSLHLLLWQDSTTYHWHVAGATGEFKNATGEGTWTFSGHRKYTVSWKGVLSY